MVSQTATAVGVISIVAARTARGVEFRWRSAGDSEILGYNLYREQRGRLVRLNRTLIPSVFGSTTSGHGYAFLDRSAPRGKRTLRYRLQAVNLDGKRSWVGATSATH